jgi:SPX domain protein involved in polyphosphate accumulation
MKFGRKLEEEVFTDWSYFALDYKALKNRLKAGGYSAYDDEDFQVAMEIELDKVSFHRSCLPCHSLLPCISLSIFISLLKTLSL